MLLASNKTLTIEYTNCDKSLKQNRDQPNNSVTINIDSIGIIEIHS